MSFFRRVTRLGLQVVPKFASKATLIQSGQCYIPEIPFPEAEGIFNIACLGFYPRSVILSDKLATFSQPQAISFWAKDHVTGIDYIFGQDEIVIPQGSEYWAVSWLAPPVAMLQNETSRPQPEDFFKVRFGLKL